VKASRDCILWIAGREALVLVAYEDGDDDGVPRYSIGFGDNSAKPGDKTTPKEAWKKLVANIRYREKVINKLLKRPVTQHQYDSIMEAYYQGGTRNLEPLAELVNAGEAYKIPEKLPSLDTNKKGEHKEGLKMRRQLSAKIAKNGDYGQLFPIPMYNGNPRKTERFEYTPTADELELLDA
jgi:GH24 family phage-related lysozyme (muramidase)